ncbi:MAG: hypothetical protein IPM38_16430 [Ignavibacteria bacterium]|nr:hypothetical protein [Ignavibacteria bacterium]
MPEIPKSEFASLKVFDVSGKRKISTLVNENLQAGQCNIRFDAGRNSESLSGSQGILLYSEHGELIIETKKNDASQIMYKNIYRKF